MLYPNARRVPVSEAKNFFAEIIKPSLPEPRGLSDKNAPETPFRREFSTSDRTKLTANLQRLILLSI